MSTPSLYRAQALGARQAKWLGDIVLVRPLSFTILTAFAALIAVAVLAFATWGTYTKRNAVSGELVPDLGLVKVYAPQAGIVLEKHVAEGQQVRRGQVLYVLSGERAISAEGQIQAAISRQIGERRESLRTELARTGTLQQGERATLERKINAMRGEQDMLERQLAGQQSRTKFSQDSVARYQGLLGQGFISQQQLQQKQEEALDQVARLQGLERDRMALARDLAVLEIEWRGQADKHRNELAQIERSIASLGQELTESEGKRRLVVTAPEAGTATAAVAEPGQTVDANRPLVSVVPQGATLQAHLYAPSKVIGFVRPGDTVLLRYQAFPYQKFGHGKGTVTAVSRVALTSSEIGLPGGGTTVSSEQLYRITVRLTSQAVKAYGKTQALQVGMALDADVLQETRRLYEWVLDPLLSVTGKL
jgi:membrane fusion protein